MMISSNRKPSVDQTFEGKSTVTEPFVNHLFQRVVAKEVTFEGVDFRYTIFDTCYFRKCVFQDCDFTGCRFTGSNFHGSSFAGCTFEYAVFERTLVDPEILEVGCPGPENLRNKFARTLRTNFQSLGDAVAVNKAIQIELEAKGEHLLKAWKSRESYYRNKYKGWKRFQMFCSWVGFRLMDRIWGNGESPWKLTRAFLFFLVLMAVADVFLRGKDSLLLISYLSSFGYVPAVFFGTTIPSEYPALYVSFVVLVRLVMVGFLLSIIVKRFGQR
jgi:hypothetical protein